MSIIPTKTGLIHFCGNNYQSVVIHQYLGMEISFHGAARTVTGSKFLLTLDSGRNVLLDCGMFQGRRKVAGALNAHFGFEPAGIDYVILTHAHIDHSGLLPKLVKEGFKGKIYCTRATADVAMLLLYDCAHIQEYDILFQHKRRHKKDKQKLPQPLYRRQDVDETVALFEMVDYDFPLKIDDEITLTFRDAGHILGSATVFLDVRDHKLTTKLLYTGDLGRYHNSILNSPKPVPQPEIVICESTYGNSLHDSTDSAMSQLKNIVLETCVEKGGKLVIPAFSVGRCQEVLYALNNLFNNNEIPLIPVYVDSPLSTEATKVIRSHPECFNQNVQELMVEDSDPFTFRGLKFIASVEQSKALNDNDEPCIIISASGMADAGRVRHHIANTIGNSRNTVLIIGYCEASTLGGILMSGVEEVKIFGKIRKVRANVTILHSFSAHADYEEICRFLSPIDPALVTHFFIVHGEPIVQDEFRKRLIEKGFNNVIIPELHEHCFI